MRTDSIQHCRHHCLRSGCHLRLDTSWFPNLQADAFHDKNTITGAAVTWLVIASMTSQRCRDVQYASCSSPARSATKASSQALRTASNIILELKGKTLVAHILRQAQANTWSWHRTVRYDYCQQQSNHHTRHRSNINSRRKDEHATSALSSSGSCA